MSHKIRRGNLMGVAGGPPIPDVSNPLVFVRSMGVGAWAWFRWAIGWKVKS